MTDNPFKSRSKSSNKQYVIVYGDPEAFVKYAKIPPSHSLKIEPFAEKLKGIKQTKLDNALDILSEAQQPVSLYLMAFFKDVEELKRRVDKDPTEVLLSTDLEDDDDEYARHMLYGIGRELFSISIDVPQVLAGQDIDRHRFPEDWDIVEAQVMLRTGETKSVSKGFAGMLDRRLLNVGVFAWAGSQGIATKELDDLPCLNMLNTFSFNDHLLQTDPNAPFTIYLRKDSKPKPTLKVVG